VRFRFLHQVYALLGGYFWLPCPSCGRMFGGHEWKDYDGKPSSIKHPSGGKVAICPDCTRDGCGERSTLVFWKDLP
jgi:hypothetical protein